MTADRADRADRFDRLRRGRPGPRLLALVAAGVLLSATLAGVEPTATAAPPAGRAGTAGTAGTDVGGTARDPSDALSLLTSLGTSAPAANAGSATWAAPAATTPLPGNLAPGAGGLWTQPYADCTTTSGLPYATGLPPLPCLYYPPAVPGRTISSYTDNGAYFDPITQQATTAALLLDLAPSVGRIFSNLCNLSARPCTPEFDVPPLRNPSLADFYFITTGFVYLQSPLGDQPQFGTVTRTLTHPLAFGAIPGSATVTVSQVVSDGYVTPLKLVWPSFTVGYPKGTVLAGYEEFGANPYDNAQLALDLSIDGPVTVTVSDVSVDGVPLDVDDSCHTDTTLHLYARGGWLGGTPTPGEPGEYQPFFPPGYAHAAVDVPSFSGCVTPSGEDVSPLVTGLVSGSDNPLDITQQTPFGAFGCLVSSAANCTTKHPATVDPRCVPDPSKCPNGVYKPPAAVSRGPG